MRVTFDSLIIFILVIFMSVLSWKVWKDAENVQKHLEVLDTMINPILKKESSKSGSIEEYLSTKRNFLETFYADRAAKVDTMLAVLGILLAIFGLIAPLIARMLTDSRLKKIELLEEKNAQNLKETKEIKSQMDEQFEELEQLKLKMEEQFSLIKSDKNDERITSEDKNKD